MKKIIQYIAHLNGNAFLKALNKTILRNIGASVIQFYALVIIARNLGPEKQGALAILIALQQILVLVFDFGFSSAKTYYIAIGELSIRRAKELETRHIAITTVALSIILVLLHTIDLNMFSEVTASSFVLLGVSVVVLITSGWALIVPLSFQNYDAYNLAMLSQSLSYAILISATSLLSVLNIDFVLISVILSNIVCIVVAQGRYKTGEKICDEVKFTDFIRYGLHNVAADLVTVINYRISYFACNSMLGAGKTGIYALSVSLMEKLWVVSQSLVTIYLPKLAADSMSSDSSHTIKIRPALLVMAATSLLGFIALLFLFFLAETIFGAKYHGLTEIAAALLFGIVAWAGVRVIAVQYSALGMPRVNLLVTSFCLCLNIIQILSSSNMSLVKMAMISSASYITSLIVIIILSARHNYVVKRQRP